MHAASLARIGGHSPRLGHSPGSTWRFLAGSQFKKNLVPQFFDNSLRVVQALRLWQHGRRVPRRTRVQTGCIYTHKPVKPLIPSLNFMPGVDEVIK
jgi:hypothetical protein